MEKIPFAQVAVKIIQSANFMQTPFRIGVQNISAHLF
jgi:hypothetical protein